MSNQNDEAKKIIAGLVIGVVGVGALYYFYAEKHRKTPVLKKIGRTIADVGEMIENCDLNSVTKEAQNLGQKMPKATNMLDSLSDWVSTGMSLWKKITQ